MARSSSPSSTVTTPSEAMQPAACLQDFPLELWGRFRQLFECRIDRLEVDRVRLVELQRRAREAESVDPAAKARAASSDEPWPILASADNTIVSGLSMASIVVYFTAGGLVRTNRTTTWRIKSRRSAYSKRVVFWSARTRASTHSEEVVELGGRHLAQGGRGQLDERKPGLGGKSFDVRQNPRRLADHGRHRMGLEPGELSFSNRFVRVEQ